MDVPTFAVQIPGYKPAESIYSEVYSPYGGDTVGRVELVDQTGMSQALEVANRSFADRNNWLPAYKRAEILSRTADLVSQQAEELVLLVALEGGKPLTDARAEIQRAENGLRLCAEEAIRIHGEHIPMQGSSPALGHLAVTVHEPIGVVAAVSAFNHPFNLIVHQVGPAVAAGCPVLVKPAPDTPLSCMRLIALLYEAGLPPEWAMAVPCGNAVSEFLVTSPKISFFSFIGSARVGWMLRSKLAPGVRCALEHGGAAPVVIDASADIAEAVPHLIKGGYYHAGQVCVSVQRVFVHKECTAKLIALLKEAVPRLKVGDPTLPETEVGPLIRQGEVDRVHSWVQEAIDEGAQLLTGGAPLGNQCYMPTLLFNPSLESKVMTDEIFGPVVCVREVETLEEGVKLSNASQWAFQAAVFSQDIDAALTAAKHLNAAAVMVNDHTAFRVDWMPFGGRGPSGLGVGGIGPGVHEMTAAKLVVIRHKS